MKFSLPPLEVAKARIVYCPDEGVFTWRSARVSAHIGRPAGWVANNGYLTIAFGEKKYLAHRLAWLLTTGKNPTHNIDHSDGDRLNNKWLNLREATQQQNVLNKCMQSNCKSGVQGVVWREDRSKWMAYANVNGKFHHLGYFESLQDATEARRIGALRLHGEFAFVARAERAVSV